MLEEIWKIPALWESRSSAADYPVQLREGKKTKQPTKTNLGQSKTEGTGSKVPARVYSLEQHRVLHSFEDVEDMIPVFHHSIKIWIDSSGKKISSTKFL